MLDPLQDKQRRILDAVQAIRYRRDEYDFINSSERLIALVGARGVGKTTLLLQYLQQYSLDQALYFSADDIVIANFGIYEIVAEFYKLGGRVVVIDEVHIFKEWARHVKSLYDSYPDLTIRISGSSMLNILMQGYDLSRRIVVRELKALSFREYFSICHQVNLPSYSLEEILKQHTDISFELTKKYLFLYREFNRYLNYGCYPYFLNNVNKSGEVSDEFIHKLYNSIEKVIYEDIPATNKIKFENLIIFKKLIYKIVAARVPFQVSIDKLAKELSISEPTLYTYLDILDKTGIFRTIKKQSKKISRKPAKIYFTNSNVLSTLANSLQIPLEVGTVRETYFISNFSSVFYSDVGDFKVGDIIFEVGGKNKGFEQIKNTENSYLALDIDSSVNKRKVPLWLFGLKNL